MMNRSNSMMNNARPKQSPVEIKSHLDTAIREAIKESEDQSPDSRPKRNSKLTKEIMIKTLLGMDGGSLNKELRRNGLEVSASAFCQRRNILSPRTFQEIFEKFNKSSIRLPVEYRVLAFDGCTIRVPTTDKSSSAFVYDGKDGYSAIHLNALYSVTDQEVFAATTQDQSLMNEPEALRYLLSWYDFDEKTIILADRGLESFNIFAWLLEKPNTDFVIRVKNNGMKVIKELDMQPLDTMVSCYISTRQDNESKRLGAHFIQTGSKLGKINSPKTKISSWDWGSPYKLEFRVVRYKLEENGNYYTLATSLPKELFSTEDIIQQYRQRWSEELFFRTLKTTIGISNVHSKKLDFCKQELWSALTMHNFCSRIVSQVVLQQNNSKYPRMINYKMAVNLCKEFYRDQNGDGKLLLKEISKYTEAVREGRTAPRNLRVKGVTPFVYRVSA